MLAMEKRALDALLRRIRHGTVSITYWDGETRTYGKGQPKAHLTIHTPKVLRAMLHNPSLAIGEAYMNGEVEVEEPLENIVTLARQNQPVIEAGRRLQRPRLLKLHKNKKTNQAKFIAHHYDIGNDFYKLWLDPTMTYSCAYFHDKRNSLEQAQRQKIEHILRKLQLKKDMKLLDIGCGWGHLLVAAAKEYKTQGLGVSLSSEQVAFAKRLAKREGVDNLVKFKLLNYQDVPGKEVFDRVVSVGFFEHVGQGNHADYFRVVQRLLRPDGISVLHSITHQTETPTDLWVDKYIFPGGYIPSVRETTALLPQHDFYLFDYENLGRHYAMTLEHWWRNYERQKQAVIAMYDERFYRMWRLYLVSAMVAFKSGHTHLSQWTFKKGSDPDWPLTREYLYPSKK